MVTGAFSYTGKYIARRLISLGEKVRTLTAHPDRNDPLKDQIEIFPYRFDEPKRLVESLRGVSIFYNGYWIRFPYKNMTFETAIDHSKILIESAKKAGVQKIVHISITHADERSHLAYFKGKGMVERFIRESGLHYAILRPTVVFGKEDILINNIAWYLRHFPIFGILGDGNYRLQPIYANDLAEMAIHAAKQKQNVIVDAAGPEIFTFNDLVTLIKDRIQSKAKIIHVPSRMALLFSKMIGMVVRDIVLTKEEADGLMGDLLYSQDPPRGKTRLSTWLDKNSDFIGVRYASELDRHYRKRQE